MSKVIRDLRGLLHALEHRRVRSEQVKIGYTLKSPWVNECPGDDYLHCEHPGNFATTQLDKYVHVHLYTNLSIY